MGNYYPPQGSGSGSGAGVELQVNKGLANGYAPLDAGAKVPALNLPAGGGTDPAAFDFSTLPLADPHVAGKAFIDATGHVTVSAG